MRLRIKDGVWFETTTAIRINDKLWYTQRGNWVYRELAELGIISEAEAAAAMLSDGNWFEDHDGYAELPEHVKDQLQSHLNDEYPRADEV